MIINNHKSNPGAFFGAGVFMRKVYLVVIATIVIHVVFQGVLIVFDIDNRFIVDIANRFNLDHEISVVTWFSSILAFIVSIIFVLIGMNQQDKAKKNVWRVLSLLLLLISVDEIAAAHELLLQGIHIAAGFGEEQTLLANAWLIIVPVLVLGFVILARIIHRGLPNRIFRQIVFAGLIYITGALIVEYLSIPVEKEEIAYKLVLIPAEEGLEMLGLAMFLSIGLSYINCDLPDLSRKIKSLTQ